MTELWRNLRTKSPGYICSKIKLNEENYTEVVPACLKMINLSYGWRASKIWNWVNEEKKIKIWILEQIPAAAPPLDLSDDVVDRIHWLENWRLHLYLDWNQWCEHYLFLSWHDCTIWGIFTCYLSLHLYPHLLLTWGEFQLSPWYDECTAWREFTCTCPNDSDDCNTRWKLTCTCPNDARYTNHDDCTTWWEFTCTCPNDVRYTDPDNCTTWWEFTCTCLNDARYTDPDESQSDECDIRTWHRNVISECDSWMWQLVVIWMNISWFSTNLCIFCPDLSLSQWWILTLSPLFTCIFSLLATNSLFINQSAYCRKMSILNSKEIKSQSQSHQEPQAHLPVLYYVLYCTMYCTVLCTVL